MKTKFDNGILKLANGTKICKYCGKEVVVTVGEKYNPRYYDKPWDEYECDCKEWNNAISMNKELRKLNNDFYKAFCDYEKNYRKIIDKYNNHILQSSVS